MMKVVCRHKPSAALTRRVHVTETDRRDGDDARVWAFCLLSVLSFANYIALLIHPRLHHAGPTQPKGKEEGAEQEGEEGEEGKGRAASSGAAVARTVRLTTTSTGKRVAATTVQLDCAAAAIVPTMSTAPTP